jgi:hypothetical protein
MIIAVVLAGCAPSNCYPLLPVSLANRTDELGRQFVKALAERDRQKLIALGQSPEQVDKDLSDAPVLRTPAEPHFLLDMLVADSYARQYSVALAAGGEVEIRCWFTNQHDNLQLNGYQVFPHAK